MVSLPRAAAHAVLAQGPERPALLFAQQDFLGKSKYSPSSPWETVTLCQGPCSCSSFWQ